MQLKNTQNYFRFKQYDTQGAASTVKVLARSSFALQYWVATTFTRYDTL